ncbi:MAG: hypothetical protein U0L20_00345 [Ruminococcus sp.]|nr:hypothetical protein [Ruminococcus sp.]
MKELYEKITIDIVALENDDVITASSGFSDIPNDDFGQEDTYDFSHDNSFIDWGLFE